MKSYMLATSNVLSLLKSGALIQLKLELQKHSIASTAVQEVT
jgi:hypothetical protein